jgi:REP element-mobilizing transposase RayT
MLPGVAQQAVPRSTEQNCRPCPTAGSAVGRQRSPVGLSDEYPTSPAGNAKPGPEGRTPNVSPARQGWESISQDDPSAEARHQTCYPARSPLRHMSHSYSNNYVHAIYSTKDRQILIPPEFEKRLYSFIAFIPREHKIPILAAGGMPNHSHLLFMLPATISLASAINTFKANSSRFMHERGLAFQWQNG